MASGGDLQMSEDKARYYRYIALLNDGGKLVLLAKYDALVPNNNILLNLQQQKHKIRTQPLRKRISDTQYELLYPASGQADPSTFDLTLLTFLLRSTCGLRAKSAVWDPQTPPVDSEIFVEADVARMRNLRNKLIGHPEKTVMSTVEFEDNWESLKKILLRLGSTIPDLEDLIDDLKVAAMEPDREMELQAVKASWEAAENLLQGAVADLREDVDQLQNTTKKMKREVEEVKETVRLHSLIRDSKEFLEDCESDEVYVKTEDYEKAKKKLLEGDCVVISGLAGEGKTTMAKHLVWELSPTDKCLVLQSPDEWEKWNDVDYKKHPIEYLIIDDIFGAGAMDRSWVKTWETNLKKVQRRMKKAKFKLIITTRQYILQEAKHVGNFVSFFESENVIHLSSKNLSRGDRIRIFEAHLKKNRRAVDYSFVESCIDVSKDFYKPVSVKESRGSVFGFPQCVDMFVSNDELFDQGSDFFSNPKKFYMAFLEGVLRDDDHNKILALILTWARGRRSVRRDDLRPPQDTLEKIAQHFGFTLKNSATLNKVLKFLEHHTDDIFDYRPSTGSFTFDHNVIKDMVGLVLCKAFPKQTLYYASRDFILEYVTTDESENDKYHFHVEEYMYRILSEKLRKLLFPDRPTLRSKDVNVNHLRNGGRCPNKVIPTMVVDVDITAIDAFKNERFISAFVQYEQETFGETFLFDKPAMIMSGYFLGTGIEMEPIILCLPDYCLLNGNPLILVEQIKMRPRQRLDISLTIAVRKGLNGIVRLLLKAGAVATTETVYLAAVQEDTDVIEMLMSRNEHLGTSEIFKIVNGNSPLITSARKGLLKSVKVLVEYGADKEYRNANGLCALDKAVLFGHTDVSKVLLEAGSPVNERHGKFKRTPLHVASDNGSVNIVRLLLQHGAEVDMKDHRGHYPIHCAAFRGRTKVVEALLKHDPSLAEQTITSYGSKSVIRGMTVFHIAIWRSNPDLMQMLVNSGAKPSVPDCYGRTPLYVAAHDGKYKLVELLLPHSNPNEADKQGRTPLHVTLMKGHWSVAELLCSQSVNVNTMDKDGTTPLHEACKRAFTKDHFTKVIDMVRRCGADYLIRDKQGRTAYDVATPRVRSVMEEHFDLRH